MHVRGVALALVTVFFLVAKADAAANATASSGTSPSTGDRPSFHISAPSYAGDEERIDGIKAAGWGEKVASFFTKSKQTMWEKVNSSLTKLKVAWWRYKDVDPHALYVKLQLDKSTKDILANPNLDLWVKYVKSYNEKHLENQVSIHQKLRKQFGDYGWAIMLQEAKKDADQSIRAIGATLQTEQLMFWKEKNVNAVNLYKLLQRDENKLHGLDKDEPRLLSGPALDVWNAYASKFFSKKPTTLFQRLYLTFDDASLTSLLLAGKQSQETATLATELQRELRRKWLDLGVKPEVIFTHLKLDKNPFDLLDQPGMQVWMQYVTTYRARTKEDVRFNKIMKSVYKPNEIKIIIGSAKTKYGKHLANRLATAA